MPTGLGVMGFLYISNLSGIVEMAAFLTENSFSCLFQSEQCSMKREIARNHHPIILVSMPTRCKEIITFQHKTHSATFQP